MRSGSLTQRFRRCGKAGCHCAKSGARGHGPVLSLTRKRAGKTVTRVIPARRRQTRVAEYHRFRQLSKAFVAVNDALSEARLATGVAAKKNPRTAVIATALAAKRRARSSGCWEQTRRGRSATSKRSRRRCAPLSWPWPRAASPTGSTPDHSDQYAAGLPCGCGRTARLRWPPREDDPHGPRRHDPRAGLLPLRAVPDRVLSA